MLRRRRSRRGRRGGGRGRSRRGRRDHRGSPRCRRATDDRRRIQLELHLRITASLLLDGVGLIHGDVLLRRDRSPGNSRSRRRSGSGGRRVRVAVSASLCRGRRVGVARGAARRRTDACALLRRHRDGCPVREVRHHLDPPVGQRMQTRHDLQPDVVAALHLLPARGADAGVAELVALLHLVDEGPPASAEGDQVTGVRVAGADLDVTGLVVVRRGQAPTSLLGLLQAARHDCRGLDLALHSAIADGLVRHAEADIAVAPVVVGQGDAVVGVRRNCERHERGQKTDDSQEGNRGDLLSTGNHRGGHQAHVLLEGAHSITSR